MGLLLVAILCFIAINNLVYSSFCTCVPTCCCCCCCCCWVASVVSDSVQPHRRQPTRPPRPWDSPGKNIGVGCHFLLQCMKVKSESEVAQSCPTLSDPMDCSPLGSSIHGIFQARVLEWGAIAFYSPTSKSAERLMIKVNLKEHLIHAACSNQSNRIETSLFTVYSSVSPRILSHFRVFDPYIIPSLRVNFLRLRNLWFCFFHSAFFFLK